MKNSFLVILSQVSLMAISTTVLSPIWAALLELYAFNLPMGFSWLIVAPISYGLMWVLPLFGVTVFLNRCRICIEHGLALSIAAQFRRTGAEFGDQGYRQLTFNQVGYNNSYLPVKF